MTAAFGTQWRGMKGKRERWRELSPMRRREALYGLAFVSPWIIGLLLFSLFPFIASFVLSFTRYDVINPPVWIGLANYEEIFSGDSLFLKSLLNTAYYVVGSVAIRIVLAFSLAMRCDVSDEEEVAERFAETVAELGKVTACFANAGVSSDRRALKGGFSTMTTAEWRRVLDVNLDGVFFTLRAAAGHMVERGIAGSLAATSSLAAIMGQARGEHYGAGKGALIAMMRALAVEYGPGGIRANSVLPGWIETPMTEPAFNWDRFRDAVLPRVPVGRWGEKEDFGGIAVYLVSDASRYHSGDTFVIDGAYSLF